MRILHYLALRLFFSLLILPFAAAFVLELLHQVFFPGIFFQDAPVLIFLWLILFAATHFVLSAIGMRRFRQLDQIGWQLLTSSDDYGLREIFSHFQKLIQGGLIPLRRHRQLENLLLRRYFEFYRKNIEKKTSRRKLLLCLQHHIHPGEAFQLLKDYLLQQPELTLELVDLAEQLHEFEPADQDIVEFMVEKYLQDEQIHFRAEYFYQKELEKGGEFQDKIIQLCLRPVLASARLDDFAGWLFWRAWETEKAAYEPQLGHHLYRVHRYFKKSQRKGLLAEKVAEVIARFSSQQIAEWQEAMQMAEGKKLSAKIARAIYFFQQKLLFLWGELKRHRQYIYYAAGAIAFALVIYLILPAGRSETEKLVAKASSNTAIAKKLFSLQVGATKNARAAQKEIRRLKKVGLDAYVLKPTRKRGWYRIRIGKFRSRREAQIKGDALRRKRLIKEYFLVNYETGRK